MLTNRWKNVFLRRARELDVFGSVHLARMPPARLESERAAPKNSTKLVFTKPLFNDTNTLAHLSLIEAAGEAPNPLSRLCGSAVVVYQSRVSRLSPSLLARHRGSVDLKEPRVVFSALGVSSHCALTHSCVRTSPRVADTGDGADTGDDTVEVCPMCRERIA